MTDLLDQCGVFRTRLFRESCVFHQGCYVKDLSRLGRDLHKTLILDNSPASYIFHPDNAVSQTESEGCAPEPPVPEDGAVVSLPRGLTRRCFSQVPVVSWFDDADDSELLNLLPLFEDLSQADNVYARMDQLRGQ